ncbi:MAG: EF-hand domain-containing protein, partial [Bacteroidota bacterium]
MKKLQIGLIALSIMFVGSVTAQNENKDKHKEKHEDKHDKHKDHEKHFEKLDKNNNGVITLDEMKKAKGKEAKDQENRFKKMDLNGDGKITKEEFYNKKNHPKPMMEDHDDDRDRPTRPTTNPPRETPTTTTPPRETPTTKGDPREDQPGKVDVKKDKKLPPTQTTDTESNKSLEQKFALMDKNGNGEVTLEELKAGKTGLELAKQEERFKRMDKNADGKITKAEFMASYARDDSNK